MPEIKSWIQNVVHIGWSQKNGKTWMTITIKKKDGTESKKHIFEEPLQKKFDETGKYKLTYTPNGNFYNITEVEKKEGFGKKPDPKPGEVKSPETGTSSENHPGMSEKVQMSQVAAKCAAIITKGYLSRSDSKFGDWPSVFNEAFDETIAKCRDFCSGKKTEEPEPPGDEEGA